MPDPSSSRRGSAESGHGARQGVGTLSPDESMTEILGQKYGSEATRTVAPHNGPLAFLLGFRISDFLGWLPLRYASLPTCVGQLPFGLRGPWVFGYLPLAPCANRKKIVRKSG